MSGTLKSGNPISYYNGTRWTMTWKNGRELATAAAAGTSLTFDYDLNGLRTQKTVGGVQHHYVYASGTLLRETWSEGGHSYTLDFFYDESGRPYIVFYTKDASRARFYYMTNLQGDVVAILNTNGQIVTSYSYEPFGKLRSTSNYFPSGLASEIGALNPLRYRGYYYDTETEWYYLQSRYYDPMIGRFINADSYASTGQGFLGYNMFAYCNNTPTLYRDDSGTTLELTILGAGMNKVKEMMVALGLLMQITDDTLAFKGNSIVIAEECADPLHPTGTALVRAIVEDENAVRLWIYNDADGLPSYTSPDSDGPSDRCGSVVGLNRAQAQEIVAPRTTTSIILAHEMIHAYHHLRGVNYSTLDKEHLTTGLGRYSRERVTENRIRSEHGMELRRTYQ